MPNILTKTNERNEHMIANLIPARYRAWIYTILATAFALEAIWDVVPDGIESRVAATVAALGFVLARGNTPTGDGDTNAT